MQSTTAGSKEARQLEKVKKAFEDAYRNTKAKTNTAQDGGVRYSLYSRPNFTKDEWSIVNRRKHSEFDNPKYDLDENRKWMYAKEKGSTVFAVYSKSDPDDPTVLYGSSGKSAERDYAIVGQFIDGGRNNVKRGRKALDRLLASIQSDEGNGSNDSTYAEGAQTATGDVQFPVKESGSHGGRDSIDGTENLGQETVIEHDEEASDDSGASSITWSNDYAAIRNFMKDGDTGDKYSLSTSDDLAPTHGDLHISGKDVAIDFGPVREDLVTSQTGSALEGVPIRENTKPAQQSRDTNTHISLEDYANSESPVWRNVAYDDEATKTSIMQQTHADMVAEGLVVKVTDDVIHDVDQAFPDLRSVKKAERNPILKDAMKKLKTNLRNFLNGFKEQSFEFEVNGKVLDATLYNTGINEVLEKVTKEKANMLYSTEGIFKNARYLYSTPDYDGDPNVYRWNYFYTPVQIGEETVGVRIAVRDVATPRESQIYNWGIKKDASLGGVGRGANSRISHGASSDASNNNILQAEPNVNSDQQKSGLPMDPNRVVEGELDFDGRKQRRWVKTSTESDVVDGKVLHGIRPYHPYHPLSIDFCRDRRPRQSERE